jgi:hypothetical protein
MTAGRQLIVAYDSGGAEVVSAWVAAHPENDYRFLLAGPAARVFERKLPQIAILPVEILERAVEDAKRVITGTGWTSDLEKRAIERARHFGVPVAAYLDHWVNYRSRFELHGALVLPDEIWVGDEFALQMARKFLPEARLKFEPNQYFVEMRRQVALAAAHRERGTGITVLYVTEPTSVAAEREHGNPRHWGYTEFEALDGYLTYIQEYRPDARIVVRPHPAEPAGKYDALVDGYRQRLNVRVSSARTLVEDCGQADWVVGCDSMAMAVAAICGKQVFSSLPSTGPELTIPFPEIIRLFPRTR